MYVVRSARKQTKSMHAPSPLSFMTIRYNENSFLIIILFSTIKSPEMYFARARGKGKYSTMDNTKMGMKMGKILPEKIEVSG
jgi:hypothetical protein